MCHGTLSFQLYGLEGVTFFGMSAGQGLEELLAVEPKALVVDMAGFSDLVEAEEDQGEMSSISDREASKYTASPRLERSMNATSSDFTSESSADVQVSTVEPSKKQYATKKKKNRRSPRKKQIKDVRHLTECARRRLKRCVTWAARDAKRFKGSPSSESDSSPEIDVSIYTNRHRRASPPILAPASRPLTPPPPPPILEKTPSLSRSRRRRKKEPSPEKPNEEIRNEEGSALEIMMAPIMRPKRQGEERNSDDMWYDEEIDLPASAEDRSKMIAQRTVESGRELLKLSTHVLRHLLKPPRSYLNHISGPLYQHYANKSHACCR